VTIKLGGSEVVGQVSAVRREAEVGWDDVARVAGVAGGKGGEQKWVRFLRAVALRLGTLQSGVRVRCPWRG